MRHSSVCFGVCGAVLLSYEHGGRCFWARRSVILLCLSYWPSSVLLSSLDDEEAWQAGAAVGLVGRFLNPPCSAGHSVWRRRVQELVLLLILPQPLQMLTGLFESKYFGFIAMRRVNPLRGCLSGSWMSWVWARLKGCGLAPQLRQVNHFRQSKISLHVFFMVN